MGHETDFKFSGNNAMLLNITRRFRAFLAMIKQSEIKFISVRLRLKSDIFRTAPSTDDDVASTTCIFGF